MNTRCTRRLQVSPDAELVKMLVNRLGYFCDHVKLRALGGIEIEKNVVGMDFIIEAARPGIMINAAEICEIQQVRKIIRDEGSHLRLSILATNQNVFQPLRQCLQPFFLKKEFPTPPLRLSIH